MSDYEHWLVDEQDHIVTLTLNRPQADNRLLPQTFYELRDITVGLRGNKDAWVVVVQGVGKHFSAGIDLDVIRGRLDQPEAANVEFLTGLQHCLDDFEALEKPTIAKLTGFCIGGGLLLALCCDFRIASQRTVLHLPEVRLGLGVIMGTQRLIRVVGVVAAKEMILLGKRLRAGDALSIGLVHDVVPPGELDRAVAALAERFLALPPRTVGLAKRFINEAQDLTLQDSQRMEIDAQVKMMDSHDLREAMDSFIEQRRPCFTGE
jgi:enoyl-CoA hydratase/carnithine racemase